MSPSPPQEAVADNKAQDELDENGQAVVGEADGGEHSVPPFPSVSHPKTRSTHLSDAIYIFLVVLQPVTPVEPL
jgi:hypothetical protein